MDDETNDGRDPSKCPRNKPDGSPCGNDAGKGTEHKGMGPCYKHGGRNKNWNAHFEKALAVERMRTYGSPIDTDPKKALMEEVQRTAGHVFWLGELVADLQHGGDGYEESINDEGKRILIPRSGLKQLDAAGRMEKASVWIELYQNERTHLARVCKMALDAGVQQSMVDTMQQNAQTLGEYVRGVLNDPAVNLSDEQKEAAKVVFMRDFQKKKSA